MQDEPDDRLYRDPRLAGFYDLDNDWGKISIGASISSGARTRYWTSDAERDGWPPRLRGRGVTRSSASTLRLPC